MIAGALLLLAFEVGPGAVRGRRAEPQIGFLNWAVMIVTLGVNFFVAWYEAREGGGWAAPSWWPTPRTRARTCWCPSG